MRSPAASTSFRKPVLTPDQLQIEGSQWLAVRPAAYLCDDAGTGKTLTGVLAADRMGARSVRVFCPGVVKEHWGRTFRENQQTYQRHIDIPDGFPKRRMSAGQQDKVVAVFSHACAASSAALPHMAGPWDLTIWDEGDEYRNVTAARTKNAFGQGDSALWRQSYANWNFTGTPIVNSAADMFPFVSGPLARALGQWQYEPFCHAFTDLKPDEKGLIEFPLADTRIVAIRNRMVTLVHVSGSLYHYPIYAFASRAAVGVMNPVVRFKPTGIRNPEGFRQMLEPHLLRRLGDVGVPLRIAAFPVGLTDDDLWPVIDLLREIPRDMVVRALELGADFGDSPETFEEESISRVRHALGLAKARPAALYAEHLLSIGAGPLVLGYWHRTVLERVMTVLPDGIRTAFIDGTVHPQEANSIEQNFQAGKLDLLMLQVKSGGSGITLTRSDRMAVIESPWTARDLWQLVKRLHRKTQTRPVLAEILFAEGCWLDELMAQGVASRASASQAALGS